VHVLQRRLVVKRRQIRFRLDQKYDVDTGMACRESHDWWGGEGRDTEVMCDGSTQHGIQLKIGEDCAELGEDEVVSHAGEQRVRQDGVGGWDVEFFDGVEDLQHVELSPLSLLSFFMSSFVACGVSLVELRDGRAVHIAVNDEFVVIGDFTIRVTGTRRDEEVKRREGDGLTFLDRLLQHRGLHIFRKTRGDQKLRT
jgi:hypothetical protein